MKILVIGSGGREHALAWKLTQSPLAETVYVAPGNAGTAMEPGMVNVDINPMDLDGLVAFARDESIDLTVVGPEDPLVAGIVDRFSAAGLRCFGPTAGAAQLEGSKSFTKDFLEKYSIPTAAYRVFDEVEPAIAYLADCAMPIVIKADGLAAGKGVVIAQSLGEAEATVRDMLSGEMLAGAGSRIVIEDFLKGEEASFIVIADGEHFVSFASSQDHKAAFDGDEGPNTGGMGAYSPAPVVTADVHDRIIRQVINPTIEGMKLEGYPYTGFLYAGLMIDPDGQPQVIEFNCRFGDPETQPVMSRLSSDLVEVIIAAVEGKLDSAELSFDDRVAVTVVLASGGYPGSYEKGRMISGLADVTGAKVFHAGTAMDSGKVVTAGGRVLGVTALGATVSDACRAAYSAVGRIGFDDMMFRRDIGYRAIAREKRTAS